MVEAQHRRGDRVRVPVLVHVLFEVVRVALGAERALRGGVGRPDVHVRQVFAGTLPLDLRLGVAQDPEQAPVRLVVQEEPRQGGMAAELVVEVLDPLAHRSRVRRRLRLEVLGGVLLGEGLQGALRLFLGLAPAAGAVAVPSMALRRA